MTDLADAAESIARRHHVQRPVAVDEARSLVNYAEAPHRGDWTLRSALVRLAQPHPRRAEAVLELVRRLDSALGPMTREIHRHGVVTQRRLPDRGHLEPVPDGRTADLAMLIGGRPGDVTTVITGYERVAELSDTEKHAVPILACAAVFDELAATLAQWASKGSANPPVATIDSSCRRMLECLDAIGAPAQEPPERFTRSRS